MSACTFKVCRGCTLPQESSRLGFSLPVIRHPLIHFMREAHGFRGNVIDKHGAVDADGVQVFQQRFRRMAVLQDVVIVAARLLHDLKRPGLEHLDGLNVDVAVSDWSFVFF